MEEKEYKTIDGVEYYKNPQDTLWIQVEEEQDA